MRTITLLLALVALFLSGLSSGTARSQEASPARTGGLSRNHSWRIAACPLHAKVAPRTALPQPQQRGLNGSFRQTLRNALYRPERAHNGFTLFNPAQHLDARLSADGLTRRDILRIVKERCRSTGLSDTFCNHTFRGTGITVFLQNGGSLEAAQDMANHSDPRTTKLYDRRKDLATLSEIERRIAFE